MKKFIAGLVIVLIMFVSICSCTLIEVDKSNSDELYSRKDTEFISSSENFGKGMGDDIYVALQYIYDNQELQEKYGTSFEVLPENVICFSSEGSTRLFYMYEGSAEYGFKFEKEVYRVKLSKTYKGKWKVDSCGFEN